MRQRGCRIRKRENVSADTEMPIWLTRGSVGRPTRDVGGATNATRTDERDDSYGLSTRTAVAVGDAPRAEGQHDGPSAHTT